MMCSVSPPPASLCAQAANASACAAVRLPEPLHSQNLPLVELLPILDAYIENASQPLGSAGASSSSQPQGRPQCVLLQFGNPYLLLDPRR